MFKKHFKPEHINATAEDLAGNGGIGRYVLLPGSEGRAKDISQYFSNVTVKTHHRCHNLYLGTLSAEGHEIDVAVIPTGMGCPSTEIIVHELFHLGARRFIRVGSAGSLQPWVKVGEVVNVQASVRDELTTRDYAPIGVPAVASLEVISAILLAAEKMGLSEKLHVGSVHCKSSLYAREFGAGPRGVENKAFDELLVLNGILATEMETATLFIQSQVYNHELMLQNQKADYRVLAGAILGIISADDKFDHTSNADAAMKSAVELAIETVKTLAVQELFA